MHIAMFLDQPAESLGGAQLSVLQQAKYLRLAGHQVTLCAPASNKRDRQPRHTVPVPSVPITLNKQYRAFVPGTQSDVRIDAAFAALPPVDIVHVQADFWGAIAGLSFAKRHGIPSVVTYHNNVAVGGEAVLGQRMSKLFIRYMSGRLQRHLKAGRTTSNPWQYLATIGSLCDERLAPTAHFATRLKDHGVASPVGVVTNGLDDAELAQVTPRRAAPANAPLLLWSGRMSPEKRLMEFLEACSRLDSPVKVSLYGEGELRTKAERFALKHGIDATFHGAVRPDVMLQAIAGADVLVQTSIGFETQGRTVLEAMCLSVPVVVSDPLVAAEYDKAWSYVPADDTITALAACIRTVVSDIRAGTARRAASGARQTYLQSVVTKQLLEVYGRIVSSRAV